MSKGIKEKLYDRATGEVLELSPGIVKAKLRFYPERYTLDIPKNAKPVYNKKEEKIIHVAPEEKAELLKDEIIYADVEEVKESEGGINYIEYSLTKLRKMAKEQGMKNTNKKNKDEVIEFLNNK